MAAGADGVIYGFTRDGRVFYTRYAERRPDALVPAGAALLMLLTLTGTSASQSTLAWEGAPVEVKHDLPGFQSVFPQLSAPDQGVH
jgi:hypothetical protein